MQKVNKFETVLESLLALPELTDLCVNAEKAIFIDRGNGMEKAPIQFTEGDPHLWVIQNLSLAGLSFDAKNPFIDFQLRNRHRVHVLFPPCASSILISIRKLAQAEKNTTRWSSGSNEFFWNHLKRAVISGENMLISGATGSGKTTLMNDLLSNVPSQERIIALEDVNELAPTHSHFLSLLSHRPNADGFGAITLRTLLAQTLRMRPDRIVIGECRGPEVLDFLQLLNTGHKGAMATVHAESCRDALYRLELLSLLSGQKSLSHSILKTLISRGIRWISHVKRNASGQRQITEVQEVVGCESDTILLRPVLNLQQTNYGTYSNRHYS